MEISDGKLKGTFDKTFEGEQVYAFLGIPYAKPPIGELRFKVKIILLIIMNYLVNIIKIFL